MLCSTQVISYLVLPFYPNKFILIIHGTHAYVCIFIYISMYLYSIHPCGHIYIYILVYVNTNTTCTGQQVYKTFLLTDQRFFLHFSLIFSYKNYRRNRKNIENHRKTMVKSHKTIVKPHKSAICSISKCRFSPFLPSFRTLLGVRCSAERTGRPDAARLQAAGSDPSAPRTSCEAGFIIDVLIR